MNYKSIIYDFGEIVYLKTDKEQEARIITAISLRPSGVTYCLALIDKESWHYDIEITKERDIILATSN